MADTRVLVAMSGGVDSAAAAALLQREGHAVEGVHLRLSDRPPHDERDARNAAEKLGVPFHVLDLREEFQSRVVDYFTSEYARGRTPNPCAVCNEGVKFAALFTAAAAGGFDRVATGHYARIERRTRRRLLRAKDPQRDQSYFLFLLKPEQLRSILLPLGELGKEETRRIAESFGLSVHDKAQSLEICFIDGDYRKFLERSGLVQSELGPILDLQGKEIGRHGGVHRFTVGQREGIGIPAREALYVVETDPDRNAVVVGRREDVFRKRLLASGVNWVSIRPPREPVRSTGAVRYRHRGAPSLVSPREGGEVLVEFEEPQWGITPGQAVVFYDGDVLLGGGWIDKSLEETQCKIGN